MVACPVCGAAQAQRYHDRVWSREHGAVLHCARCDVLFLSAGMAEEEEAQFYRDYGAHLVARGVQQHDDPRALSTAMLPAARARLPYVGDAFPVGASVLEVGASSGSFLTALREVGHASDALAAVEPSAAHRSFLAEELGIATFAELADVPAARRFDVVCMFHVFEHVADPGAFLQLVRDHLAPNGALIIEVPSRTDPLLALYHLDTFKDFYFQPMHPVVYSPAALARVLAEHGYSDVRILPYQRYGLANHLGWLQTGKPGGTLEGDRVTPDMDARYRRTLERVELTDTIFAVARQTRS